MLYYVLVYECVLVQMLSARSWVLTFNRLSNHSVVVLQVSCHLCQFEPRTQSFCICKYTMFFYCDDSLGSEKEFCSIYTAVCIFVIYLLF